MIRTALIDAHRAIIAPHCLGRESDPRRTGPDPRPFVEAVLWNASTGCSWRALPDDFGKWITVFKRFRRSVNSDAFYRIFRPLAEDADFEYAMVEGSIVKLHRHGQGAKGDSKPGHRALSRRHSQQDHGADRCTRQPD